MSTTRTHIRSMNVVQAARRKMAIVANMPSRLLLELGGLKSIAAIVWKAVVRASIERVEPVKSHCCINSDRHNVRSVELESGNVNGHFFQPADKKLVSSLKLEVYRMPVTTCSHGMKGA